MLHKLVGNSHPGQRMALLPHLASLLQLLQDVNCYKMTQSCVITQQQQRGQHTMPLLVTPAPTALLLSEGPSFDAKKELAHTCDLGENI